MRNIKRITFGNYHYTSPILFVKQQQTEEEEKHYLASISHALKN